MSRLIVVGVDGSAAALAALRWAAAEARATGARVTAVHAVGLLEHAGMATTGAQEDAARQVAVEAGLDPGQLAWRIADGEPCAVLLRESAGADLLVVGTRGAGAHSGTMLGSTSLALAERARLPLVVVPSVPH